LREGSVVCARSAGVRSAGGGRVRRDCAPTGSGGRRGAPGTGQTAAVRPGVSAGAGSVFLCRSSVCREVRLRTLMTQESGAHRGDGGGGVVLAVRCAVVGPHRPAGDGGWAAAGRGPRVHGAWCGAGVGGRRFQRGSRPAPGTANARAVHPTPAPVHPTGARSPLPVTTGTGAARAGFAVQLEPVRSRNSGSCSGVGVLRGYIFDSPGCDGRSARRWRRRPSRLGRRSCRGGRPRPPGGWGPRSCRAGRACCSGAGAGSPHAPGWAARTGGDGGSSQLRV
jgi:hypothetical protein